jgi:hypothetical protein
VERRAGHNLQLAEQGQHQLKVARDQVKAARKQTELTRRTLQAGIRPLLTETIEPEAGLGFSITDTVECSASFRNVGPGVAVIIGAWFAGYEGQRTTATPNRGFVPHGDTVTITAMWDNQGDERGRLDVAQLQHYGSFSLLISYMDSEGEQRAVTRLDYNIDRGDQQSWLLRQVAYQPEDEACQQALSGVFSNPSPGSGFDWAML